MMIFQCPSLPTCIYNSVILLCNPRSCCCKAVFSPLREVICCWILLFSAFWKLKCLFLSKFHITFLLQYEPTRLIDSSSHRLFSLSALTLKYPSSFWGFGLTFYGCWASWKCFWFVAKIIWLVLLRFGAFPSERLGWIRNCFLCRSLWK